MTGEEMLLCFSDVGCRLGDEGGRLQHRATERGRYHDAERHQDACARERYEEDLHVAGLSQIFNHRTVGYVARDRREIDRADQRRAAIALVRLDVLHALVVELELIAHAAVEYRRGASARVRR